MDALKSYIIDFYKTHDKNVSINFYDVMNDLNMSKSELDTLVKSLIKQNFIHSTYDSDNVAYTFCLN